MYNQHLDILKTVSEREVCLNLSFFIEKKKVCNTKLELETLEQGLILEILFAGGFVVTGILINKTGKFPILCRC